MIRELIALPLLGFKVKIRAGSIGNVNKEHLSISINVKIKYGLNSLTCSLLVYGVANGTGKFTGYIIIISAIFLTVTLS